METGAVVMRGTKISCLLNLPMRNGNLSFISTFASLASTLESSYEEWKRDALFGEGHKSLALESSYEEWKPAPRLYWKASLNPLESSYEEWKPTWRVAKRRCQRPLESSYEEWKLLSRLFFTALSFSS